MTTDVCADKPATNWFIYLVRTGAGSLYAGISTDPERRLRQHQSGKGARALRGKGPLTLVWRQGVADKGEALRLEYRLKQQSKAFKERLVLDPGLWHGWSQPWLSADTAPIDPSP
ncbi:GIY-YIG nuclease family protein [Aeromonas media]|uniref:GIY-YIG nuclease family protein n=1 Tax=Aeromonas media TaxID=651 RepID=UPI0019244224|nr:GIY-YIG nuclease family protein [Aeromonas media]MBL0514383.1 GIY-YIG nuclease family protein [Aeromonas media]